MAPSLFQPFDKGALSELYLGNGVNRFSLVDGDLPAPLGEPLRAAEPDYYRGPLEGLGGKPEPPLTQPVNAIFGQPPAGVLDRPAPDRPARRAAGALPLALEP